MIKTLGEYLTAAKRAVLIVIISVNALLVPAIANGTAIQGNFSFNWSCPQAVAPGSRPSITTQSQLRLPYRFDFPEHPPAPGDLGSLPLYLSIDDSSIRALLAPFDPSSASFDPRGPDYFPCIRQLISDIYSTAMRSCLLVLKRNSEYAATASQLCSSQTDRSTGDLRLWVARISEAAVRRNAAPLVAVFSPAPQIVGNQDRPSFRPPVEEVLASFCNLQALAFDDAVVARSREFMTSRLSTVLERPITAECRHRILSSYFRALAEAPTPSSREALALQSEAISALRRFLPPQFSEAADVLARGCMTEAQETRSRLRNLETEIRQIDRCVDLPVGPNSFRVVDESSVDPSTGVPARYKLLHPAADRYVAEVNLNFEPQSSRAHFQSYAQQCMDQAARYLRGPPPQNARLEVRIGNPSGPPPAPRADIFIHPAPYRANSMNWSDNIDCSSVTHELMHVLGLVDEYHETAIGFRYNPETHSFSFTESEATPDLAHSNCRAEGPFDSLMSNHMAAFATAHESYEAFTCSCRGLPERIVAAAGTHAPVAPFTLSECRRQIALLTQESRFCPGNLKMTAMVSSFGALGTERAQIALYNSYRTGLSRDGNSYGVRYHRPAGTLLHPAHFRAITQPGCASANRLYYICARLAYSSGRDRGGEGCPQGIPAECRDQEAWLR